MSDIDWLSVYRVVREHRPVRGLTNAEKRMVMRRMLDKMLDNRDPVSEQHMSKLSYIQVGELIGMTDRSVHRIVADLPPAEEMVCPRCRNRMWVYPNGVIEPHPLSLIDECPMSGEVVPRPRGLAALRPDLYRWYLEVSA